MSGARAPLRRVVVAGSGQVGVLAAIGLKRAVPGCEVIVLDLPTGPLDFADFAASAMPATNRLHEQLRISEDAILADAEGSHRLLIRYFGWGGEGQHGAQPYGAVGHAGPGGQFADRWGGGSRAETQAHPSSLAEILADSGRFRPPPDGAENPLAPVEYGLRWNPRAYRSLLIAEAQKLGIAYIKGPIDAVRIDEDGVKALEIGSHGALSADLFVDCSGAEARLLSALPGHEAEDWGAVLPDRRILIAPPGAPMIALEDRITLSKLGWVAEFAGRAGLQVIMGAASGAAEDGIRAMLGAPAIYDRTVRAGCAKRAWRGNVIALGDAAARFEPLGFYHLDLAHRMLALLLELLPGREIEPLERAEFNRRSRLMMRAVRDVIALHYAAPEAGLVFGAHEKPASLVSTIDQFTRRGRLPFQEEGALMGNERIALLQALGFARGTPPQERVVDARQADEARRVFAEQARRALADAPPYAPWLLRVAASRRMGRS